MTSLLPSRSATVGEARRTEDGPGEDGPAGDGSGDAPPAPPAPGPFAAFVRFVVLGGGVGVLSSVAVGSLAAIMPWVVANAVITVASTVLCTELHARFTFGAGRHAGWREHWQSAGSATAAYGATSAAMLALHLLQPSAGVMTQQAVYLGASGLAGIGRFLVLRLVVFADARVRARSTSRARVPARGRKAGEAAALPAHQPLPAPPESAPRAAAGSPAIGLPPELVVYGPGAPAAVQAAARSLRCRGGRRRPVGRPGVPPGTGLPGAVPPAGLPAAARGGRSRTGLGKGARQPSTSTLCGRSGLTNARD